MTSPYLLDKISLKHAISYFVMCVCVRKFRMSDSGTMVNASKQANLHLIFTIHISKYVHMHMHAHIHILSKACIHKPT